MQTKSKLKKKETKREYPISKKLKINSSRITKTTSTSIMSTKPDKREAAKNTATKTTMKARPKKKQLQLFRCSMKLNSLNRGMLKIQTL